MVMTEENIKKTKISNAKNTRINRRRMLKAGAVIAPLAITLHGGIPMAHAASTGCVEDMKKHVKIPHYEHDEHDDHDDKDSHDDSYHKSGDEESFDPKNGVTGRIIEDEDGSDKEETHWDYIINEEEFGASCLQSFEDSGLGHSDF